MSAYLFLSLSLSSARVGRASRLTEQAGAHSWIGIVQRVTRCTPSRFLRLYAMQSSSTSHTLQDALLSLVSQTLMRASSLAGSLVLQARQPVERRATDGASGGREGRGRRTRSGRLWPRRWWHGICRLRFDAVVLHRVPLRRCVASRNCFQTCHMEVSRPQRRRAARRPGQGLGQRAAITIDWADRLTAPAG